MAFLVVELCSGFWALLTTQDGQKCRQLSKLKYMQDEQKCKQLSKLKYM